MQFRSFLSVHNAGNAVIFESDNVFYNSLFTCVSCLPFWKNESKRSILIFSDQREIGVNAGQEKDNMSLTC